MQKAYKSFLTAFEDGILLTFCDFANFAMDLKGFASMIRFNLLKK